MMDANVWIILALIVGASFFFVVMVIVVMIGGFMIWRIQSQNNTAPSADHIAFQVSDLDKSINFYTRKLGLRLLFQQKDEIHHEAFAFLEVDGCNLELLQQLDEFNEPIQIPLADIQPPYCPHFAIEMAHLDDWAQTLRQRDISIVKGPMMIPNQVKWMYIHDPDGNIIEFVEWL